MIKIKLYNDFKCLSFHRLEVKVSYSIWEGIVVGMLCECDLAVIVSSRLPHNWTWNMRHDVVQLHVQVSQLLLQSYRKYYQIDICIRQVL